MAEIAEDWMEGDGHNFPNHRNGERVLRAYLLTCHETNLSFKFSLIPRWTCRPKLGRWGGGGFVFLKSDRGLRALVRKRPHSARHTQFGRYSVEGSIGLWVVEV